MSVIVKGMKMPKNCLHCDFDDSYGICACRNEAPYVCEYSAKQRPSWCPLEELPSAQPVDKDTNVHCTDTQPKNENEPLKTGQNAPFDEFISRKAAIDAVKKNTFRLTFAEEQNCEGHVAWSAEAVYSDVMEGALLELPSAQPETHEKRTETHACDYINRKDAIDAHYEYCNKHPDAGFPVWSLKILEDLPSADLSGYSDRLWHNAYERGKAEAQQRWIPCSERLPEKDGDYLTTLTDKDGNYVDVTEWQNIFGGRWIAPLDKCDYCEIGNVVAWMPLPEPYKKENR